MPTEIRDLAPGLWIWRREHPDWVPHEGWDPPVTSTCVESRGEVELLDPIVPEDDATDFWVRLDARPPSLVVVLKPDQSCPAAWSRSRTGAGEWRRRFGYPSSGRSSSPTA